MHTEIHPFEEFIPPNATSLIVGSFPPIKLTVKAADEVKGSCKVYYEKYFSNKRNLKSENDIDFYYGSRDNLLWRDILSVVFDTDLSTVEKIKSFLEAESIGITDVVQECKRSVSAGSLDSFDSSLEIIKDRDVIATIRKYNIKKVYTTSIYVTEKLSHLDKDNYLQNVEIVTLLSPSKASSRSIGRCLDYKEKKKNNPRYNTIDYRIERYRNDFGAKEV